MTHHCSQIMKEGRESRTSMPAQSPWLWWICLLNGYMPLITPPIYIFRALILFILAYIMHACASNLLRSLPNTKV